MQQDDRQQVSGCDDDSNAFCYVLEGSLDPTDLKNLPSGFRSSDFYKHRQFMRDDEELAHIRAIVASYFNYKHDAFRDLTKMERDYFKASQATKDIIGEIMENRFDSMRKAIQINYDYLGSAVQEYIPLFTWGTLPTGDKFLPPLLVAFKDVSKLRSTLRQIAREWSAEGQLERDSTFKPCIDLVESEFFDNEKRPNGAGLGRLPFEFVMRGFCAQANEFSYHMLIVANSILNEIEGKETWSICPNIHNLNNKLNAGEIFKEVRFPDICLAEEIDPRADFSMVAGEFLEVYSKQKDTAHNIVEYLQTIYSILKKGGIWVNIGPLLYHYAEMPGEASIELTWDEVRQVAFKIGFTIEVTKLSTDREYS